MMTKAFITLLSDLSYIPAIQVLRKSMDLVNTKYPLQIAVVDDLDKDIVRDSFFAFGNRIKVSYIPRLRYNGISNSSLCKDDARMNTASKIGIFSLHDYDKYCYIDADTMLLKNIDDVFDYSSGAMLFAPGECSGGFSALFVYNTFDFNYDLYRTIIQNIPNYDGYLFSELWYPVKHDRNYQIDLNYCIFFTMLVDKPSLIENAKCVHFCNKQKPWLPEYKAYFLERNNCVIELYNKLLNEGIICSFSC